MSLANNRKTIEALALAAMLSLVVAAPSWAGDEKWLQYSKEGQAAYEAGKYRKAEKFWLKAVKEADRSEVGDVNLALSHKRLGEVYMAEKKYRPAEEHLRKAVELGSEIKQDDPEAIRALLELTKTYRSVNLEQFGKNIAIILKQSGLEGIEISNGKNGNSRVVVKFADKFSKHITSPEINQVNVDKQLTFDIHEAEDGTITLSNIKGLKVRSKFWINLKQSSIAPNGGGSGKPMALITAEKLGLTKTVETVLPKPVYEKISAIVERIRHPELHSPWHKQLQERMNQPANTVSTVTTVTTDGKVSKVPITLKDEATAAANPGAQASKPDSVTAAPKSDQESPKNDQSKSEAEAAKNDTSKSGAEALKNDAPKSDPAAPKDEASKTDSVQD